MNRPLPPKPKGRPKKVSLLEYGRLFRKDILSAQPDKLYGAWMADFKTPFFRSVMVNDPTLLDLVLKKRPDDFPKSGRISEGLRPLLGESVFLTNGAVWKRQRRLIDPAFEGGRLKETFPAMKAAAQAAVTRLQARDLSQPQEIEEIMSHAAADVIFRTLFSIPIEEKAARDVFEAFRAYQRTQPLLNIAALIPLPRFLPRYHRPKVRRAAKEVRSLIEAMVEKRAREIKAGTAPNDLATKIMTAVDPETGESFTPAEMVDQVAIFFLAGHETSASALAWALYLVAMHPEVQRDLQSEFTGEITFSNLSKLPLHRNVFREALRLYPPVPMMVRETTCPERFRERALQRGTQVVLSPWHLQRHTTLWENPDGFDPYRWTTAACKASARDAYMPFSAGPRVCTGAGFAMVEGVLLLAEMLQAFDVVLTDHVPVPQAHLTVRAQDGIWLSLSSRNPPSKDIS